MDIIEFSDKQKRIRLRQEALRRQFTQLLKEYKDLDKQYGYNEYRELNNGLLDIPFGKFAEKLMNKLHLPYNPKAITATTELGPVDIEHITSEKYKPILHTYQSKVIFNIGNYITVKGYISADKIMSRLSEITEHKPILLKNPEEIEINKTNIALDTDSYNFGTPFDPQKFVNKILKECFNDKVAEERARLIKPVETPTTTESAKPQYSSPVQTKHFKNIDLPIDKK